jgi:amino acid permease
METHTPTHEVPPHHVGTPPDAEKQAYVPETAEMDSVDPNQGKLHQNLQGRHMQMIAM